MRVNRSDGPSAGYLALDDDEQVEVLRPVALEAAARFGIEVAGTALAAHAYNTTFRVDGADGRTWALRVGTNSASTPEHVVAQQEWMRAIAADTEVLVPEPLATPDGSWLVQVDAPAYGQALLVTAASWLEGPDVGEVTDVAVARELGRTTALLHRHALGWRLPPGGALPTFDTSMFGDEDRLDDAAGLSPDELDVLARSRERAAKAYARVYAGARLRVLHADLHGGNLKWHDGRLGVFDLDDCGLGVPALDLAISAFYLRGGDPAPEQALLAGYAEVAPLPDVDPEDLEALVADRQLLLANALLTSTTADLRRDAEAYLHVAVERLRRWLATGTFTRALPG